MRKEIYEYLNSREYDLMAERLMYMVASEEDSKCFDFKSGELKDIMGNWAMGLVYPFSNEYLEEFFKDIDLKDGRALVVGSSGDQVLHAIDRGAKDVTLVDGNMWTLPFVELKLSAMKNLSYKDFQTYMCYGNIFYSKMYAKVSHGLSERSRAFWDKMMLELPWDIQNRAIEVFAHNGLDGQDFRYGMKFHSYYTSEKKYNEMKEKLKDANVNIKIAELTDFPKIADGKYDLIMLSNIFDYVKQRVFFRVLKDLNDNHLKDTGKIQAYTVLSPSIPEKIRAAKGFEDGIQKFYKQCDDLDIKLDHKLLGLKGKGLLRTAVGYQPQLNYLLGKSDLEYAEQGNDGKNK